MFMNASEAIQFDTHKFVKHLTENGFTEQPAEALADEQVNLLNSNLATQANIESLRQETSANIADLKAYVEESKADLLKWMFIALAAQGSLIVALIKLIPS